MNVKHFGFGNFGLERVLSAMARPVVCTIVNGSYRRCTLHFLPELRLPIVEFVDRRRQTRRVLVQQCLAW
jgi:hypothetical protein